MPELKDQVLKRVHECSITPTFAMLLIAYDDPTKRMEAYYWDADRHKEVRAEKLADAFDLKRYEAQSLSRIFEAAKPAKNGSATQDVWSKDRRGAGQG